MTEFPPEYVEGFTRGKNDWLCDRPRRNPFRPGTLAYDGYENGYDQPGA